MSSRRRRSSSSPATTDEQMAELISRLHALLPSDEATAPSRRSRKVSRAQALQETCSYIRRLHREVDGLSGRLSDLLEPSDHAIEGTDAAQLILRSLSM